MESKCPKCGEPIDENCRTKALTYKCGSAVHTTYQSDRCRIVELTQQLAVARESLEKIQERCVGFAAMLAKEALRQISEEDGK